MSLLNICWQSTIDYLKDNELIIKHPPESLRGIFDFPSCSLKYLMEIIVSGEKYPNLLSKVATRHLRSPSNFMLCLNKTDENDIEPLLKRLTPEQVDMVLESNSINNSIKKDIKSRSEFRIGLNVKNVFDKYIPKHIKIKTIDHMGRKIVEEVSTFQVKDYIRKLTSQNPNLSNQQVSSILGIPLRTLLKFNLL